MFFLLIYSCKGQLQNPKCIVVYVLESDLGLFDQCVHCINHSFNIDTKLLNNQRLVDDLFTTNNYSNAFILCGFPSVQKFLQHVWSSDYPVNSKQATQTSSLCPLSLFWSHLDPLHFWDFFCFNMCLLPGHFGRWTSLLHLFLSLVPHHKLGPCLGRSNNKYVEGIMFYVIESSFNRCWPKIHWLFKFLCYFCSLFFILFFLLIIINYNKCGCRRWKISSKASQQCLFKSSHNSNTSQCFKNFLFYVFPFPRALNTFSKYRRRPWCKWFNVNHPFCYKNFFSDSLQFYFLSFLFFLSF